jgi:hypothetical protein
VYLIDIKVLAYAQAVIFGTIEPIHELHLRFQNQKKIKREIAFKWNFIKHRRKLNRILFNYSL